MRALFVKCVSLVFFVAVFPVFVGAQMQSRPANITGNYVLYREGDLLGNVVGHMKITAQRGTHFSIGIASPSGNPSLDWTGKGMLRGAGGYYDWVFKDGKRGRTTFTIDQSGNIHGKVRGSGINWDYVARRQ